MLTRSNRIYFANKSFFKTQSWFTLLFNYCFLIEIVLSKFVIDFFTRFQLLHHFELNRIRFETISKKFRFSKAIKIFVFFKHQFCRRSYFWLSKQSQFWVSFIEWTRFNVCFFIFEYKFCFFFVFEYQLLLSKKFSTYECKWRNFHVDFCALKVFRFFIEIAFLMMIQIVIFWNLLTLLLLRTKVNS